MKLPVDQRLWQYVRPIRRYVYFTAVISAAISALIITQTLVISGLVANLVIYGSIEKNWFSKALLILLVISLIRAFLTWVQETQSTESAYLIVEKQATGYYSYC